MQLDMFFRKATPPPAEAQVWAKIADSHRAEVKRLLAKMIEKAVRAALKPPTTACRKEGSDE